MKGHSGIACASSKFTNYFLFLSLAASSTTSLLSYAENMAILV